MRKDLVVFTFLSSLILSHAIPVDKSKLEESKVKEEQKTPEDTGLYYDRYLREVIDVLETDEHFKEKLQAADVEDIKNGKLGQELDFVSHKVRTKLDELKRQEVARLRMLVKARTDAMQGDANGDFNVRVDHQALLKQFEHLDHSNPHRFEAVDLSNLIKTATNDLENFDEARHEEFKRYEMMKEHERREFLKTLDEERRQEEEQKHKEMMQKHQSHPKVNHPGSKDQLKEVWEDGDGMDPNAFDPKTFFKLHDFNEDGFFDQEELEALFNKELEKVYDSKNAEDDMHEMEEERVRMREHVMNEVDKNKDRLVSFEEFLHSTQTKEFAEPDGWETLDETEIYTEEELRRFEQELAETEAKLHAKAQDLREQHDALRKEHSQLEDRKQEYQQAVQIMEQKSQQISQEKHDLGQHEQPQNPGMKQPETHENPPVVVNKHQAVPEMHPNAVESVDGKAAHPIHLEGQGQGDGKVPLQPVAAEPRHV